MGSAGLQPPTAVQSAPSSNAERSQGAYAARSPVLTIPQDKAALLAAMDPPTVARLLAEMDPREAVLLLSALGDREGRLVGEALPHDQRRHLIQVGHRGGVWISQLVIERTGRPSHFFASSHRHTGLSGAADRRGSTRVQEAGFVRKAQGQL
jgi:hypothetical protein